LPNVIGRTPPLEAGAWLIHKTSFEPAQEFKVNGTRAMKMKSTDTPTKPGPIHLARASEEEEKK
jgi:selenocysteine-specific translation elongation factor